MNIKKVPLLLFAILLAGTLIWTSTALADGGGFPTATPTITASPVPTNTPQPTNTPPAATESAEELEEFLQQLEDIEEGAPGDTEELDAVPLSVTPEDEAPQRNWLGIFLVGFTVLVVAGGLAAVLIFYQRSQSNRSA